MTVFTVAVMVIGAVSYFGASLQHDTKAMPRAPTALYIAPESGAFAAGSTFSAAVRVSSGSEPVNAVQATLNYNPSQLQFVSLSDGTAFPAVAANATETPGLIRIARAAPTSAVIGDHVVVTVTFRMLPSSTPAPVRLTFDRASSYVVRSIDSKNILATSAGASYSVRLPVPTVASITPASGPLTGGAVVTITGTNFAPGATVKFGEEAASAVTLVSPTALAVVVPAVPAGGVRDITVTNADGRTALLTGAYTFIAPPTISAVYPNSGVLAGGTKITITGTNFNPGSAVTIGGLPAGSVKVVSSTTITATAPAHAAGKVPVVVKNPDGQSVTLAEGYAYKAGGDANSDGHINAMDLSAVLSYDGQNYEPADVNGDGTVGAADMAILLAGWTW